MPYLEVQKQESEEDSRETIEMPNVTGLTITEAKTTLEDLGLEVEINGEVAEESIVVDQLPKKGIQVNTGAKVTIYI